MSNNVQSIDDQIMCMVGMGFDLEDCQAAVENGKLSVDEAIEWILNGKPRITSLPAAAPTLKLNLTENSRTDNTGSSGNPSTVTPIPSLSGAGVPAASGGGHTPMDVQLVPEAGTVDVTSRLSMSDEQRQIKLRFEEKQRDEARRIAHADKLAKKKAHAEALKRIQEDREKHKERVTAELIQPAAAAVNTVVDMSAVVAVASNVSCASDGSGDSDTKDSLPHNVPLTLLQIRLPDSRRVKHSFASDSSLQSVKEFVEGQCNRTDISLIQPFPHVEFAEAQMGSSLQTLGLVPSGSLVVKVTASRQKQLVDTAATSPSATVEPPLGPSLLPPVDESLPLVPSLPPPPPPLQQQLSHAWGAGQQLVVDDADTDMDAEEEQEQDGGGDGGAIDDSDGDDDFGAAVVHPAEGAADVPPIIAGGGGLPAAFGGHHPGAGRGAGNHPMGGFGGGPPGAGGFGGFGGGGGIPGMGMGGLPGWGGQQQHNWGARGQRLAGEVLDNVVLPHHNQNPKQLAAEAARKRYGSAPPPSSVSAVDVGPPAVDIPMLRDLVIKYVSGHICSTRNPITGLHGLPAALANRIVDHLIREGLLRPKTLQVFNSCRLQEIVLDCYTYCTNELLATLRHQIFLKSISLHSCPLVTKDGLQNFTALKSLRHLNIGSCRQVNDNCVPVLIEIPSLVTLVLENTAVTDSGIIQYAASSPQHLRNLDLSRTNVTQNIFTALQAIPHLAKLNLENTKVAGLAGVESLASLKVLNLANTLIVTDSLLCLRSHHSLVGLNIANTINVHGDTALQYLTDVQLVDIQLPDRITTTDRGISFVSNMPLTALDLTNYINITDASMEHIGRITALRKLRLSNTKVSDAGMLFLEGLKDLKELHLDRTLITDESGPIFRAFPHLHELNLSNTGITNACLASGALNCCTELSKLNLSKTNISDKGTRHLCLPVLTLLNVDDTFVCADHACDLPMCPLVEHVVYRSLRVPPQNEDL